MIVVLSTPYTLVLFEEIINDIIIINYIIFILFFLISCGFMMTRRCAVVTRIQAGVNWPQSGHRIV